VNFKLINQNNLIIIINYIIFLIPVLFLFKHNLSNFLISVLPLLIIFPLVKNQIPFNRKLIFVYIFFLYLVIISSLSISPYGIYYLRFLCLVLLIVFILKSEFINNFKIVLKFLLLFVMIDIFLQSYTGYNMILLKSNLNYISSFFGSEKIAGSYLLNILLIFSIICFYTNDTKNIKFIAYVFPIIFVAVTLAGQRMPLINLTLFYFIYLTNFFLLSKKKIRVIFISSLLLIIISSNLIFEDRIILLKDKFLKIEKYIKIDKKKKTNDRPITVAFINHEGYTKIKFRDLINNDGADYALSDESKYSILYEDVFAEGYKNNTWHKIRIKDLINSKRLNNIRFTFSLIGNEESLKVLNELGPISNMSLNEKKKYFNNKIVIKNPHLKKYPINEIYFLEYLNRDREYNKNDRIVSFITEVDVPVLIMDSGWFAHFKTGYLIWKDNKIFGAGIKKYRELCLVKKYREFDSFASNHCTTHAHNFFIEILSETGIAGIFIFYLLIFGLIIQIIKTNLSNFNKINILLVLFIIFQPIQISGRFFSSNISIFNFYIIALNFYFLINKRSLKQISEKTSVSI